MHPIHASDRYGRRRASSALLEDAGIPERPEPCRGTCYSAFEHVPLLNEATIMHTIARRRAGTDHVPGLQLHVRGKILDESRDAEYHVGCLLILHDLTVELQGNAQFLRIPHELRR